MVKSKYKNEAGGLSGELLNEKSNEIIRYLRKNLDKNIHEIILIIDTIKEKQQLVKTFKDQNNDITRILTSPISQDNKVYGVVLIKYKLLINNNE